ncbi:MAG: long-chain fatty acid--CoA ligase [Desulfuromonadales bacterium]|nr:long-chain fatty acid--CoA ligase [Desulfuromonadales bacterium]
MSNSPCQSIVQILRENAGRFADHPALSYKKEGVWTSLTYRQFYERIVMAARGLRLAGIRPGDRVIILSENRAGWAIADFGVQAARGVPVPVYPTSLPEQLAYIIRHTGAKIVFVSTRQQYRKLLSVREQIPGVEMVVSFERFLDDRALPVHTLYQLLEISHPLTAEERGVIEGDIAQIQGGDLLSIIYTSGTTGVPKGVMLTHGNMLSNARNGLAMLGEIRPRELFLSFLPLSHVLERTAGYHAPLICGAQVAFAESMEKVVENVAEVRPTMMVTVPRLLEKIYSRIHESVHQGPTVQRQIFHWALDVGRQYVHCRYVERQPPGALRVRYRLADNLVFRKIRQRFGGRLRYLICGGAPLDRTINEFMWIIGIPTFEGYGLTETSPAVTLNTFQHLRFGAVGTALPQTEVRTAQDGELLVRGPQVMLGYYRDPAATAEAVDAEGWLHTGDIARIDADGFVQIVDRKKELIITAGGKNIAPQPIENALKRDKYISQALVCGDRQPFLAALLTPNLERLLELAQQEQITYIDIADLVASPQVTQLFAERVRQINDHLPPWETIKKFAVLPRDFCVEEGELTPTLKLRRKIIGEKYRERIEALFSAENQADDGREKLPMGGTR